MSEHKCVVIRMGIDKDPDVVKFGTSDECRAYCFNKAIPNSIIRNVKQINSEYGSAFEVEEMERGEWVKYTYHIVPITV